MGRGLQTGSAPVSSAIMPMSFLQIPEGKCTATIYGFIRDNCHQHLDASKTVGYRAELLSNMPLCFYIVKQHVLALKNIVEIIKEAIRDHPDWQMDGQVETSVGMASKGIEPLKKKPRTNGF
ncbi:hypothetical protein BC831DRAFT_514990 [Entophlyctis helioformis]|nr:hypothetical protein BC831DRAFT_514990 [Entophlyctis helioformis]